jgi:hypothetical protein
VFEELQLALLDMVSPEQLAVLLEAQRLLNQLGLTTADDELATIIGIQDGISDTATFVGRIHDCLTLAVGAALNEYGVVLKSDVALPTMIAILRTVGSVEHYLIPENLVDITTSDRDNEEVVAALVPLFSEVGEADALMAIEHVEDSTIMRLSAIAQELYDQQPLPVDQVDQRELRVHRINTLLTHTQRPEMALQLARDGVRMGQPFDQLVTQVIDQLEVLKNEDLALELLGLAYFSRTEVSDIPNAVLDIVGEFTDDPREQVDLRQILYTTYHQYADRFEVNS